MRHVLMLALLGTATAAIAQQDIEPGVTTSSSALTPATPAQAGPPQKPAAADGKAAATVKSQGGAAAGKSGAKSTAHDQIELDTTQITGNKELPNVMYVVPWKRPELGDMAGRPAKSLVDEALAPVDRDVFRRQNRYFSALQSEAAPHPPTPSAAPAGKPPGG
jgi:hypothetical protein